jgi:hypothetical protein
MLLRKMRAKNLDLKANLRLVSELFDTSHMSRPADVEQIKSRVKYNFRRFSANYISLFVTIAIYSLLSNWKLVFEMAFVAIVLFISRVERSSVKIMQRQFRASHAYILYATALLAILRSSLLATLLSAACTGSVAMVAHASLTDTIAKQEQA